MATGNIFHITVDDPIYYSSIGGYTNGGKVSTYGLEAELRFVPEWGDVKLRYGSYFPVEQGVDSWKNTADDSQNIGLPNHQISVDVTYKTTDNSSLNLNGFIVSSADSYAYDANTPDPNYTGTLTQFDAQTILNLYWEYRMKHIEIGIGVSDILGSDELVLQPYQSWCAAIPMMGREFYIKGTVKL